MKIFCQKEKKSCHKHKLLPDNDTGGWSAQTKALIEELGWGCARMCVYVRPHAVYVCYFASPIHTWRAGWWGGSDGIWAGSLRFSLQPLWFSAAVIHCVTQIVCLNCHLLAVSFHHRCIDDEGSCISLTRQGSKVKVKGAKLIICTLVVIVLQCD